MPLYEDRRNAQNKIRVSEYCRASVTEGAIPVVRTILQKAARIRSEKRKPAVIALDGWYGIGWERIIAAFREAAPEAEPISMHDCFLPAEIRAAYKKPFITDDPAFGYVNNDGRIEDLRAATSGIEGAGAAIGQIERVASDAFEILSDPDLRLAYLRALD